MCNVKPIFRGIHKPNTKPIFTIFFAHFFLALSFFRYHSYFTNEAKELVIERNLMNRKKKKWKKRFELKRRQKKRKNKEKWHDPHQGYFFFQQMEHTYNIYLGVVYLFECEKNASTIRRPNGPEWWYWILESLWLHPFMANQFLANVWILTLLLNADTHSIVFPR